MDTKEHGVTAQDGLDAVLKAIDKIGPNLHQ